jgi:glycosyltransferase involved in cell wall biosynthesis
MKKIVVISHVYPYPTDTGKKVVLAGIMSYLCASVGPENVTYVLVGGQVLRHRVDRDFAGPLISMPKPGILAQFANVIRYTILGQKKSLQESLLYSRKLGKRLNALLIHHAPDLIIFDTVRIGQYIRDFDDMMLNHALKILYLEDLFSVRYRKMIDTLVNNPDVNLDPLGNFRTVLPKLAAQFLRLRPVQVGLLRCEERLVAKSEDQQPAHYDLSLLLNVEEVDQLIQRSGCDAIRAIRPSLSYKARPLRERTYRGGGDFLFLGSLTYPQNQISIERFIVKYMDRVIARIPDVKLRIIGRGSRAGLRLLAQRYGNHIALEGYVEDLDAVMASSCAMVVPLLFGSGVKLKTLEAFSAGMPVICTDYGIEGIPAKNGIHCIIENDLSRYPDHMATLRDVERNERMSVASSELFSHNYSQAAIQQEYKEIFRLL